MHPMDLTGHVALVTGGNGGIGLGMAEGLAQAGADVAVWGTNEEKTHAAAERLREHGRRVSAHRCDVGDEAQVEEAFAATVAALGKVDSCFANAAIAGDKVRFTELTLDEWRRVMRVNLEGAFLTLRAAARHMVERGEGGSLVAISSIAAVEGASRDQAYAASKAGVVAMVRGLATELASKGIRANSVLPGWVDTPATKDLVGWDRFNEAVLPRVPVKRWGRVDDFAGIAVYLASDLSRFHTGDSIVVDGGYSVF